MELIIIADKEMGITAKLNIDEVISGLDDLIDTLSKVPDSVATQIDVQGVEDVADAASDASANLEDVGSAASTAAGDISTVGESADGIDLSMEAIGAAAAHAGSGIGDIASNMESAKSETQEANTAATGLADSFGLVEGVVGSLVAVGLASWIDSLTEAAGSFQDSWLRLTLSMDGTTSEVGAMKSKWNSSITSMHETTGRRAGEIREFITQMGISGVKSSDVIVKSFDAIAGADFMLTGGKNLEGIANAFQNVIRQPTRVVGALRAMGITTDDILKSTGLSTEELTKKFKDMSVEQRAVFLSNIVDAKYGADANEGYKLSWEHVKESLSAAWDYLSRILGSLILPLVVPVLEFLTNLLSGVADAIDSLNPVFKSIGGVIILVAGGLATLAGLWAGLSSLLGGSIVTSLGGFTALLTGSAEATGLLATALGPLGWAILAVIGIVLGAIYIWSQWSDEITKFKDNIMSGDWGAAAAAIGNSFQYIGESIWNSLVKAGQMIWNFFAALPGQIGNMASSFVDMGADVINWIITGLTSLTGLLDTVLNAMLISLMETSGETGATAGADAGQKTGNSLIDGLVDWINTKGPVIFEIMTNLLIRLLPLLLKLVGTIMAILAVYMFTWGRTAALRLISGIITQLTKLPGRMWALLVQAALSILRFGAIGYSYARSAGSRIVSGIESALASLPGRMYSWGMRSLRRFIDGIYASIPGLASALNTVRKYLPNSPPEMGPLSKTTEKTWYDWTTGLVQAGMKGLSNFDVAAVTLPAVGAMDIIGGPGGTSNSTNANIVIRRGAVQIAGNASTETIATAGFTLGENIAKGAISNGVNTRIDLQ